MPRPSSLLAMSAAALALCCVSTATRAQEAPPTAVVIVDGSGSMWGNLGTDKRPKLEMVREALRALLPSLRPDARVGLASFGHRRRGNCGDAEVILPPDANAAQRLSVPVEKLNAMGKAPIALALRESANAIAGASPASIVLIADDLDNCGQDICAVVGEIAAASPNLVVHTVALGFDKPKLEQVSCIARQTGGKLWDAQDAAGFASALGQAVNLANLQSTPSAAAPETAQGKPAADKPAPARRPAFIFPPGLGETSATLDSPVHWRITKAGADGALVRDTRAAALFEKLEPGTYEIEAQLGLARARQTVEVGGRRGTAGPRRSQRWRAQDAGARQGCSGAAGSPVFTVTSASADAGDKPAPIWVGRETHPEIVLPAGDYTVAVQNGIARQQSKVTITPATGTSFNSMLQSGSLELSATRGATAGQGEPVTEGVTFILSQDDPDAPQGRREVARSAAPAPTFTLPAGTYYVTARTSSAEVREQLAIGAGDAVKRAVPLALARIKLAATLGGQPPTPANPVTFRIVRLDGEPREIARTIAKEPRVRSFGGPLPHRGLARRQQRHLGDRDGARRGAGAEDHFGARRRQRHLKARRAGLDARRRILGGAGREAADRAALEPVGADRRARAGALHRQRRDSRATAAQRHRDQGQRAPHLRFLGAVIAANRCERR